ncbi:DUF2953 domain-containing protein [Pseudalkalibacillus hwajinpoensis]|uniref:DUF2953 domain-containing protein n=1 Tax=Guptibacillus hwajinpoensis TaxID=208199 RepID=A0A4U1MAE3_9BACL|nr:DUF2953 domain-containing protein [Pseudalkalibacillus hwajinpoensis]TKD67939.1 DUF2953 domain-containing protein [Pseudalkalibacillus hwajinpoensis]
MIIAIVAVFGLLLIASVPLIIFSTVKVTVTIEHSRAVEELQIDVKALFGLLFYSTAIPLKELLESGEEAIKDKAEETTFKGDIQELLKLFKKTHGAKDAIQFILEKTSVRKIQWETNFGMTNAANTAVGAELLLNAKIALFALLSHYSNLLTVPQLIVTPIYEMKTIQTYIKCMITFKLGHAMIAVIKLMKSQKNIQGT